MPVEVIVATFLRNLYFPRKLQIFRFSKRDILDNMVYMMEQHTENMENLVEERNGQLSIEKKRIESLLARMLPKAVTKQLKQGKEVEAETFEQVSIYFSDIVGFTSLCAESTAMEVSFNTLYHR